jgi:hypothetical protein
MPASACCSSSTTQPQRLCHGGSTNRSVWLAYTSQLAERARQLSRYYASALPDAVYEIWKEADLNAA